MILEKQFNNRLLTNGASRAVALCTLVLLACSTGCVSSGALQPHQAFRQATAPYQGYYQGQQAAFQTATPATAGSGTVNNFAGYRGYNNSLPGYSQPNPATGSYGSFGSGSRNTSAYQPQYQGGFQQYQPSPAPVSSGVFGSTSRNFSGFQPQFQQYQPAYGNGFTSGSC